MNEAEKCPVCRSDGRKERGREDGEYVAYYVCDTCMFMCGLEDLPRIHQCDARLGSPVFCKSNTQDRAAQVCRRALPLISFLQNAHFALAFSS